MSFAGGDVHADDVLRRAESVEIFADCDWTGKIHYCFSAQPILFGSQSDLTFIYDADLMVGIDTEAQDVLERLASAVRESSKSVVLGAGDLLVVDNHVAVHGRTPFVARFDGTDRWLQRTFVVSDLSPSASDRIGRIITTTFD